MKSKNELKKEAKNYAERHAFRIPYDGSNKFYDDVDYKASVKAYLASAEPREKRIAELERKLKVETELSNRLGLAYREYEQLTKEQDEHLAELEKENAELKADNDARKFAMAMSEKVEKQLREENAKLKTDYEVLSCSVGDFGELQDKLEEDQRKNNGLSDNLTKAKEIIKELCGMVRELNNPNVQLTNVDYSLSEAEQFLNSEVEK
jgi:chromosome segregation ATPase